MRNLLIGEVRKRTGLTLETTIVALFVLLTVATGIAWYVTFSTPAHMFYASLFLLVLSGLLLGAIYALVSAGLTIIYGTMDLVNFSHGSFLMLAMYASYWLFALYGLDPYLALPLVAGLFFLIGFSIEKSLVERILNAPLVSQFLLTFCIMVFIENSAVAFWTVDARSINTTYSFWLAAVGDIRFSFTQVVAFAVSLVVSGVGYLFLTRTWWGLALTSTAQNRDVASIVGVNIYRAYSMAFGMGISLVSIAGVLLSTFFPTSPYVGETFLLVAFLVVVLGGLGNYMGALISGLIIGVTENMFAFLLAPQFKQISYLALFILILLFRPEGIFRR